MEYVIYLDQGYFKLASIDEWIQLSTRYRLKHADPKVVDVDLSLFNAMQGSISQQAQSFLKELHNGN